MEKVNLDGYVVSQRYVNHRYVVKYECSFADSSKVVEAIKKDIRYRDHRRYECTWIHCKDKRPIVQIEAEFAVP